MFGDIQHQIGPAGGDGMIYDLPDAFFQMTPLEEIAWIQGSQYTPDQASALETDLGLDVIQPVGTPGTLPAVRPTTPGTPGSLSAQLVKMFGPNWALYGVGLFALLALAGGGGFAAGRR